MWLYLGLGFCGVACFVIGGLPTRARHWSTVRVEHAQDRIRHYHEEERDMKGLPPHERCGCDRCATWRRRNWHRLGVSA
jgi:hypothetical protein